MHDDWHHNTWHGDVLGNGIRCRFGTFHIEKLVLTIDLNPNQVLDNDEDNYSGIDLLDELVL